MRKSKVVLDFIKLSVTILTGFAKNIVVRMTGNANFTTPDVLLANITTAINTLEADYTAAQTGAHVSIAKMRQSRKALEELLRKQAQYVDRIANGNEVVILSSGFNVSKQPAPSKIATFSAEHGDNSGEILLKLKAVQGARSYTWQYFAGALPNPGEEWIFSGVSTKASYLIKDLEPGTKYWFRAAAVTPEGMAPWCDPVMKIVA